VSRGAVWAARRGAAVGGSSRAKMLGSRRLARRGPIVVVGCSLVESCEPWFQGWVAIDVLAFSEPYDNYSSLRSNTKSVWSPMHRANVLQSPRVEAVTLFEDNDATGTQCAAQMRLNLQVKADDVVFEREQVETLGRAHQLALVHFEATMRCSARDDLLHRLGLVEEHVHRRGRRRPAKHADARVKVTA
jgi:hypothetical protein